MRRVWLPGLAGLLALMLVTSGSIFGDDQPKEKESKKHSAQKPVAPESAAPVHAENGQASKMRLPAGFAKLSLTPEQHQRVIAVQEKYSAQMKQLQAQLRDLRGKLDNELAAILSESQKKSLAEAKSRAQEARAQKRTAAKPVVPAAGVTIMLGGREVKVDPDVLKKALQKQAEENARKASKGEKVQQGQPAAGQTHEKESKQSK